MKQYEDKGYKSSENVDLITIVSQAFVLRMPLEEIPKLKAFLNSLDQTKLVYQRTTAGLLRIVEE